MEKHHLAAALAGLGHTDIRFVDQGSIVLLNNVEASEEQLAPARFIASKAILATSVNDRRDAVIAAGFAHDFGEGVGVRVLDQRGPADETAWLGLKLMTSELVAADAGETPVSIRDAANGTFECSAAVASQAISAMGAWRAAVSKRGWDLKDAVSAAENQNELDEIDISSGWPSQA